jgi:hypothetical protein
LSKRTLQRCVDISCPVLHPAWTSPRSTTRSLTNPKRKKPASKFWARERRALANYLVDEIDPRSTVCCTEELSLPRLLGCISCHFQWRNSAWSKDWDTSHAPFLLPLPLCAVYMPVIRREITVFATYR